MIVYVYTCFLVLCFFVNFLLKKPIKISPTPLKREVIKTSSYRYPPNKDITLS